MKRPIVIGLLVIAALAGALLFRASRSKSVTSPTAGASASAAPKPRPKGPIPIAESIYDGKLGLGWEDWGWGPHELRDGSPARVKFSAYGGVALHHRALAPRFGGLQFRYLAPREWGDFVIVTLKDAESNEQAFPSVRVESRHVVELADGWRDVWLSWKEINPSNLPIDRILIGAYR